MLGTNSLNLKVFKQWELPMNCDVRLVDDKGIPKMVKFVCMDGMYAKWYDPTMPEGERTRIGNLGMFIEVGKSNPTGPWFEPVEQVAEFKSAEFI